MLQRARALINFRVRLAHAEALPQLVLLGILAGVASGGLIILFRLAIDLPLAGLLPGGDAENFEALDPLFRVVLPLLGALGILLLLAWVAAAERKVGVVHVLERLGYHQGRLPFRNLLVQFIGGTLAIWSGHSIGREGPSIHLGAACSSLLGQWLQLPNNSLRILVGCGTAAAISAGFNTPLAGVIFAMEVVLLEYTIVGFTPVIVSAVTAALLIQLTYGAEPAFAVPPLRVEHLAEIVFIILLGGVIGVIAALFNGVLGWALRCGGVAFGVRLLLAGALTGVVAYWIPQVMGIGYDTVSGIIRGEFGLGLLVAILVAKCLLTPLVIGLGIPGGLIGPALFIGAAAGGVVGHLVATVAAPVSEVGLYAMLGMASMMAAVLNAPLAALVALLELTGNPNIIFPAMIAIVVSNLTIRHGFKLPSAFQLSLQAQGLDHRHEPLSQALSRSGVGSVMSRQLAFAPRQLDRVRAAALLEPLPSWVVVADGGAPIAVLSPKDLGQYLALPPEAASAEVDLLEIPALRHDVRALPVAATLKEALDRLDADRLDALYVENQRGAVIGVITRRQIEGYWTRSDRT